MKILATLDGSPSSEAILPLLTKMLRLPAAEVVLFSVVEPREKGVRIRGAMRQAAVVVQPGSTPIVVEREQPMYAETKGQAIERVLADRADYLTTIRECLSDGAAYDCVVVAHEDPACAIIERALVDQPDVIVMATHGRTGLIHILFGDVAEEVVRSGVAPVLLVHPEGVRNARMQARPKGA